jgi:hypothetical protein
MARQRFILLWAVGAGVTTGVIGGVITMRDRSAGSQAVGKPAHLGPPDLADVFHVVDRVDPVFTDSPRPFSHRFEVTNRTSQSVHVRENSCGCTCSSVTLGSDVLEPGQKTTLAFDTTIGPPAGMRSFGCTLITDFAAHPNWSYAVEVPVYPRMQLVPARLAFGTVEASQSCSRSLL